MHTVLSLEAELPRSMILDPALTDAEFEALCAANDLIYFERTRDGEILMQLPAGGLSSHANAEIGGQLRLWWKAHRRGMLVGSSCGFFLPDGSMLNPDAAYILQHKLKGLTKDDLTGFPRLCPDFVVELLSIPDSISKAQRKMEVWIENGATLCWLIDPYEKKVYVYEAGAETSVVTQPALPGTGPVEGFTLDLEELWRCYEI